MILIVAALCASGIGCGCWLFVRMRTVPLLRNQSSLPTFSVVIPARNEADNLPRLLLSMRESRAKPAEVVVVDDGSTDTTAAVARAHGVTVIVSQPLPEGWTGKAWACWQGAAEATAEVLVFLDADTFFAREGLTRMVAWSGGDPRVAVSALPYHATELWYEELSLFFNLMMAAGSGGFSASGEAKLFGQSLVIGRDLYYAAGGHSAVRANRLENLAMSPHISAAGGTLRTAVGRGVLLMRMFPEGFAQLLESWSRSAVVGAGETQVRTLLLSIAWLSGAMIAVVALCCGFGWSAVGMYLLYAVQIGWIARRLGAFRWLGVLLYPVPLLFYFGVFGWSVLSRRYGGQATWKGRQV